MNKLFRKQDRDIGDFNRVKTYKKKNKERDNQERKITFH